MKRILQNFQATVIRLPFRLIPTLGDTPWAGTPLPATSDPFATIHAMKKSWISSTPTKHDSDLSKVIYENTAAAFKKAKDSIDTNVEDLYLSGVVPIMPTKDAPYVYQAGSGLSGGKSKSKKMVDALDDILNIVAEDDGLDILDLFDDDDD